MIDWCNPHYWRIRAAETHMVMREVKDAEALEVLRQIADGYEQMVVRAEIILRGDSAK